MSGKIRKKRIKEKSARLIFCIALYAVLALFIYVQHRAQFNYYLFTESLKLNILKRSAFSCAPPFL